MKETERPTPLNTDIFKKESLRTIRTMASSKSNLKLTEISPRRIFDITSNAPKILTMNINEIQDTSIRALLLSAEKAYLFERYEECINIYKQILTNNSKCTIAIINLSAALFMKKMYMGSFKLLNEICLKKKEYFIGTYNKVLSLVMLNQHEVALKLIKSLLNLADNEDKENIAEIKKFCEKQIKLNRSLKSNTKTLNRTKTLLNLHFPYIQQTGNVYIERKINNKDIITQLEKTATIRNRENSVQNALVLLENIPKPLQSVTSAYSNFVSVSRNSKKKDSLNDL